MWRIFKISHIFVIDLVSDSLLPSLLLTLLGRIALLDMTEGSSDKPTASLLYGTHLAIRYALLLS